PQLVHPPLPFLLKPRTPAVRRDRPPDGGLAAVRSSPDGRTIGKHSEPGQGKYRQGDRAGFNGFSGSAGWCGGAKPTACAPGASLPHYPTTSPFLAAAVSVEQVAHLQAGGQVLGHVGTFEEQQGEAGVGQPSEGVGPTAVVVLVID